MRVKSIWHNVVYVACPNCKRKMLPYNSNESEDDSDNNSDESESDSEASHTCMSECSYCKFKCYTDKTEEKRLAEIFINTKYKDKKLKLTVFASCLEGLYPEMSETKTTKKLINPCQDYHIVYNRKTDIVDKIMLI